MTDAEYRKTVMRLRKAAGKWQTALGLGYWRITYEYESEGLMPVPARTDGQSVAATSRPDWRYKHATINFNVPVLADQTDDDLERFVLHELTHVLVNELREEGLDHEERVVSELTSAFMWTEAHRFGKPIAAPKP